MSYKLREILRESKCRREVSRGSMTLRKVVLWEPGQDMDTGRERGSSFTKGTIFLPLQELPNNRLSTCIPMPPVRVRLKNKANNGIIEKYRAILVVVTIHPELPWAQARLLHPL